MPSNPQILSDLALIKLAGHQIELLSVYKGVPFICKANVEQIGDNSVALQTNNPALVCLECSNEARLLGSDYFEPAMARLESIDLAKGTITMKDLVYAGARLGERMIVRVEPREPIPVTLETAGQIFQGEIADLSISGLGIWLSKEQYQALLKPGVNVQLAFQVRNEPISLAGVILGVSKAPASQRISLRFAQGGAEKLQIFHYLIDRRAEIEAEVLEMYHASLKATGG
jgi:hypothetical protein